MLMNSWCIYRTVQGSIVLAGLLVSLGPTDAWAQAASDVDCSKCVDTDDIAKKAVDKKTLAKGAVDSSRIADGAVKAKDLADGAVEGSKLAAGAVTGGKLADSAVTGAKMAPNAVDGSKLAAGAIGSAKFAGGAVTMDKVAPDAVFGRVIVVRADPADQTGNCDALKDRLAGITDNDADNRYTVLLEPGIYDCGGTPVEMKDFVDLQGSGRGVTQIAGSVAGNSTGVVLGASDAELRRLSVENADVPVGTAIAIYIGLRVTSFRVTDVHAVVRNSELPRTISLFRGTVVLTNVLAETINTTGSNATALNFFGIDDVVELVNVTARTDDTAINSEVAVGIVNQLTARNSVFKSETFAVNTGTISNVKLVSTQLDAGNLTGGPGAFSCLDSYDGNFAVLLPDCS